MNSVVLEKHLLNHFLCLETIDMLKQVVVFREGDQLYIAAILTPSTDCY